MKVGIFSDVHANLEALDAVLSFLSNQGAQSFACCGDLVGYGPDPAACIERVRSLGGPVVAGNHDYGAVGRITLSNFNQAARQALNWTRDQLSDEDGAYLGALPLTQDLGPIHLVHSSPSAPDQWEYVLTVIEADQELDHVTGQLCVIGHSHYPFVVERRPGEAARLVTDGTNELRPDSKYLVNVGSVGQPRDGDPRACCLLCNQDTGTLSLHRVEYDISAVQAKMREAGLPEFLANRLTLGR